MRSAARFGSRWIDDDAKFEVQKLSYVLPIYRTIIARERPALTPSGGGAKRLKYVHTSTMAGIYECGVAHGVDASPSFELPSD
jgi:hypothetical protein